MLGLIAAATVVGPVVVHDSRESSELASVGARPATFAPAPVVYERQVGEWRQWWLAFADNDQDRGIVRTGRHAGDWELVQVREGVEAVYAQHSGAERCPWDAVELRDGRPVVYLANGSHAAFSGRASATARGPTPTTRRTAAVAPWCRPWSRSAPGPAGPGAGAEHGDRGSPARWTRRRARASSPTAAGATPRPSPAAHGPAPVTAATRPASATRARSPCRWSRPCSPP